MDLILGERKSKLDWRRMLVQQGGDRFLLFIHERDRLTNVLLWVSPIELEANLVLFLIYKLRLSFVRFRCAHLR